MNMLLNSDGYHLTMGYLIGEDAMQTETHILYARSGGPMVVPNLAEIAERYTQWRPTAEDIKEADAYWCAQGIPFARDIWEQIAAMPRMPITIRGAREGEVVMPGEPIAIIEAPAILAAVPEPYFISEVMKSAQLATRFTKIAKALGWERNRVFEVGMRAANSIEDHTASVKVLASVGLGMTSSGVAGMSAGIASGGSMGHRYTQRFTSDYDAFNNAVDRMIEFRKSRGIENRIKLSLLLDTRNTLSSGLPAVVRLITERKAEIAEHLDMSVRLDSGDLDTQVKVIIGAFKWAFAGKSYMPSIIIESGLVPEDIARFERIADEENFPRSKMLYGVGGYLVGAINRDFVSMVYKVSSYGDTPTMKFADEADGGKMSYPGRLTLIERETTSVIERQLVKDEEVAEFESKGWHSVFVDIIVDGKRVVPPMEKEERIRRIEWRWEKLAEGYIGNEKNPSQFPSKPNLSPGVLQEIEDLRKQHFYMRSEVANSYEGQVW